jgi:hypothetical protein
VYFDRSGLPSLDAFVRFEPPTIGEVHDARGKVLIELAREYRRVVSYDEVPLILRQAILATEDKNFFSHSGVEYRSLPWPFRRPRTPGRLAEGRAWLAVRLPQGGSTLTQQLVRGYFLQDQTRRENGNALLRDGWTLRFVSAALGVPASNKLCRKLEEIRLALWLEEEMRRRYGSQLLAKREIFARYASFIYLGNSRQPRRLRHFSQTAGELHGGWTWQAIGISARRLRLNRRPSAPPPPQRDPGPDGAQRLHPSGAGEALPDRADPRSGQERDRDPGPRRDRDRLRRAEGARREPLQHR